MDALSQNRSSLLSENEALNNIEQVLLLYSQSSNFASQDLYKSSSPHDIKRYLQNFITQNCKN